MRCVIEVSAFLLQKFDKFLSTETTIVAQLTNRSTSADSCTLWNHSKKSCDKRSLLCPRSSFDNLDKPSSLLNFSREEKKNHLEKTCWIVVDISDSFIMRRVICLEAFFHANRHSKNNAQRTQFLTSSSPRVGLWSNDILFQSNFDYDGWCLMTQKIGCRQFNFLRFSFQIKSSWGLVITDPLSSF